MLSWVGSVVWQRDQVALVVDGVCDGWPVSAGGAELAVQLGYLVAQATVVVVEFSDAGVGEFEPLPQGRVGAALGLVDHRRACRALVGELADLVA